MLKYAGYDIVFSEIPDETTLAFAISNCPNRCNGCHSPNLWQDIGVSLTKERIGDILSDYTGTVTCICFMGGDSDPTEIQNFAQWIRKEYTGIKVGWYSGRDILPNEIKIDSFDYLKIGSYKSNLGGLRSAKTNQQLYRIDRNGQREDITERMKRPEIFT